jgi:hypothetical protein
VLLLVNDRDAWSKNISGNSARLRPSNLRPLFNARLKKDRQTPPPKLQAKAQKAYEIGDKRVLSLVQRTATASFPGFYVASGLIERKQPDEQITQSDKVFDRRS